MTGPGVCRGIPDLGAFFIHKHQWDQAIEALQTGVRLNPQDSQTYNRLARASPGRQHYADAVQAFSRFSRHQPIEAGRNLV